MQFEWDDAKNGHNRLKHGVGFDAIEDFDWETAVILVDGRHDYGEQRQRAFGFIGNRLHTVVFTIRTMNRCIISLRRANKREERLYETSKAH